MRSQREWTELGSFASAGSWQERLRKHRGIVGENAGNRAVRQHDPKREMPTIQVSFRESLSKRLISSNLPSVSRPRRLPIWNNHGLPRYCLCAQNLRLTSSIIKDLENPFWFGTPRVSKSAQPYAARIPKVGFDSGSADRTGRQDRPTGPADRTGRLNRGDRTGATGSAIRKRTTR